MEKRHAPREPASLPAPFAFWKMELQDTDNPTAGVTRDSGGNQKHLSFQGTLVPVSRSDRFGGGYRLEGSASGLVRDDAAFRTNGAVAFFLAFELGETSSLQVLVTCMANDYPNEGSLRNAAYTLRIVDGGLEYSHEYGAGQNVAFAAGIPVASGFHTVAFQRDAAARRVQVAWDGKTVINATYSATPQVGSLSTFAIGVEPAGTGPGGNDLEGAVYEARLWHRTVEWEDLAALGRL